jgi:hypothetical protein
MGTLAFQKWQLQPRKFMTKKIERSRVEAGKAELPKKVSFLSTEKVDYLLVLDREGELSVEVPAAALAKLVKARGELKLQKGAQKQADAAAAAALAAEKEAHQVTQAALAKAERRVKSLEKKLEASSAQAAPIPAAAPAPAAEKKQPSTKPGKSTAPKKAAAPKESKAPVAVVEGSVTSESPVVATAPSAA